MGITGVRNQGSSCLKAVTRYLDVYFGRVDPQVTQTSNKKYIINDMFHVNATQ